MNNKTGLILAAVVLIAGSFYGGMKYAQYQRSFIGRNFWNITGGRGDQMTGTNPAVNQKMNRLNLGGMINGEIISKDETGITVKQKDGGSRIIFLSEKTAITKLSTSTKDELINGLQITGQGTSNPDGSMNAENIQIK